MKTIPDRTRTPGLLAASLLVLPILGLGCAPPGGSGTDSGNALTAELVVGAEGSAIVAAREVATITAAWMGLDEIEFQPCGGGEDSEIDYEGPFAIDLLTGPSLGEIELSFDTVCELEFEANEDDGVAGPLDGITVFVEGTTSGGLDFVVSSAGSWEFEITEELPLQDALNRFALLFDLDTWFDGVDPDAGVPDGGTVFIDDTSNVTLLDTFESNISASARLTSDD